MIHNQIDINLKLSFEEEQYIFQALKRIEDIVGNNTYVELVLKKAAKDRIFGKLIMGQKKFKAIDTNVVSVIERLINKIIIPPTSTTIKTFIPISSHA